MQPMDGYTRNLYQDRHALVQKIARYQTDLANIGRIFRIGAVSMTVGFLLIWVGLSNITLATIGQTRYDLDPLTFGACGATLVLTGIALLLGTLYMKIKYPRKLADLSRSLQDLDDLLYHQKVFPPAFREKLSAPHHTFYVDYLRERQIRQRRVEKLMSWQELLETYLWPISTIAAGFSVLLSALLQRPIYKETIIASGASMLLGTFWAILRRRKRKRKLQLVHATRSYS